MNRKIDPRIAARWPTAESFYRERDDRTAREVEGLARYVHQPVEIHVHPDTAEEATTQAMAILAANLAARWARGIRVRVPDVALAPGCVRPGWTRLPERIRGEMEAADPFGDFGVGTTDGTADEGERPLRLFIGPWDSGVEGGPGPDDYVVYARGWTALGCRGGGIQRTSGGSASAAAAALAAALGAGDLFKRAVGHPRHQWLGDVAWSTWSHRMVTTLADPPDEDAPPVPDELDLGRVLLAGVGAIGSAVLYILRDVPLRGEVTLLDRDRVEASNLNRSPLFTALEATLGEEKTEVGRRFLAAAGLPVDTRLGTWHEHGAALSRGRYDVWISLTNEEGAWAEVPFQMPPVVLHATTTSSWGFGAGRHIPRVEDCTLCRLPHPAQEFRGLCAAAELEVQPSAPPVVASLPFLSVAAAALVVAELMKLSFPRVREFANDVSADLRVGLPAVVATHRLADPSCRGCQALEMAAWESLGGQSRYAGWSRRPSERSVA